MSSLPAISNCSGSVYQGFIISGELALSLIYQRYLLEWNSFDGMTINSNLKFGFSCLERNASTTERAAKYFQRLGSEIQSRSIKNLTISNWSAVLFVLIHQFDIPFPLLTSILSKVEKSFFVARTTSGSVTALYLTVQSFISSFLFSYLSFFTSKLL